MGPKNLDYMIWRTFKRDNGEIKPITLSEDMMETKKWLADGGFINISDGELLIGTVCIGIINALYDISYNIETVDNF